MTPHSYLTTLATHRRTLYLSISSLLPFLLSEVSPFLPFLVREICCCISFTATGRRRLRSPRSPARASTSIVARSPGVVFLGTSSTRCQAPSRTDGRTETAAAAAATIRWLQPLRTTGGVVGYLAARQVKRSGVHKPQRKGAPSPPPQPLCPGGRVAASSPGSADRVSPPPLTSPREGAQKAAAALAGAAAAPGRC